MVPSTRRSCSDGPEGALQGEAQCSGGRRTEPGRWVAVYNIDLGQVRAVVERLSGFLDGASSAVQADLDITSEVAQWYGP